MTHVLGNTLSPIEIGAKRGFSVVATACNLARFQPFFFYLAVRGVKAVDRSRVNSELNLLASSKHGNFRWKTVGQVVISRGAHAPASPHQG